MGRAAADSYDATWLDLERQLRIRCRQTGARRDTVLILGLEEAKRLQGLMSWGRTPSAGPTLIGGPAIVRKSDR
jgi:hypothetical protein